MKKKLFYYLFAVLCTATLFTSCSDDDDEVKYPIDTELAGGYVGNLSVNVDGNQMGTTENQKITISQSNKGTNQIALSLKNFTFLVNVGDIEVDLSRRSVLRAGVPVHLTRTEYRLLSALLAHPGKVLTQRGLLREIWGPTYTESSHYLRVYVGHLRQKLEVDPTQPQHFLTETGVGYRFQP